MTIFSFVSVKGYSDEEWLIAIITWGSLELVTDLKDFGKKINEDGDVLKTELIRNWDGYLSYSNIKFRNQVDADKAIEGYLQPLLTAHVLAKKNGTSEKRERA